MTYKQNVTTEYKNVADASFPSPWNQQLEFSSPARGTWNIVHTGMLIPESHEIFVCAKGCLRGVVLTAAEAGEMGRYSALEIKEENVLNGDMEDMMVDGVTDIINKLHYRPRAILLFISCQHFFLAYDQDLVFERLREKFPDIEFTDCYMIPTLRKSGITPDQKMRIQMYSMLKPRVTDGKRINLMGSNHAIEKSCELYDIVDAAGCKLGSLNDCRTFDEYLALSEGRLGIIYEPLALKAAEDMERRLGIPYVYLPSCYRFCDIEAGYDKLMHALGMSKTAEQTKLLEAAKVEATTEIEKTLAIIGDRDIVLDYTFGFRPANLARFMIENGFCVTDMYVDAFAPEEKEDFEWLKANAPWIKLHPTNRPSMRFEREDRPEAVALGQKAALFAGTDCFVNIAEGGGLFGFKGVTRMMQLLRDAVENPKDRRYVAQKKGTGVKSLLDEPWNMCCASSPEKAMETSSRDATACLVPTYSSDEFGICSTLYELGGMVVMHDASGCNSTYTTHDEPRWYDSESMIYISAISEMEAIMGDDDKLIRDIKDAAMELKPKFIAIVGAPIPYMIGTDIKAIANVLERDLGIPVMGFPANGMNGYGKGISMATKELVSRFCEEPDNGDGCKESDDKLQHKSNGNGRFRVNILGATPLDYALNGTVDSIKEWLYENGMEACSSFSMDSSLDEIRNASSADVNLVVSYGGLAAAKLMKLRFGIPYVVGTPFGRDYAKVLAARLRDDDTKMHDADCGSSKVAIIGEAVRSVSLARALEADYGISARVICSTDTSDELLRDCDIKAPSEDAVVRAIEDMGPQVIIADPFYQAIVSKGIRFVPLPHEAFSGRIYDRENPNLVNTELDKLLPIGDIRC